MVQSPQPEFSHNSGFDSLPQAGVDSSGPMLDSRFKDYLDWVDSSFISTAKASEREDSPCEEAPRDWEAVL